MWEEKISKLGNTFEVWESPIITWAVLSAMLLVPSHQHLQHRYSMKWCQKQHCWKGSLWDTWALQHRGSILSLILLVCPFPHSSAVEWVELGVPPWLAIKVGRTFKWISSMATHLLPTWYFVSPGFLFLASPIHRAGPLAKCVKTWTRSRAPPLVFCSSREHIAVCFKILIRKYNQEFIFNIKHFSHFYFTALSGRPLHSEKCCTAVRNPSCL